MQEYWNQYRQVLDRQWGWELSFFYTGISSPIIKDIEYSIDYLITKRKAISVRELIGRPAELELRELSQAAITGEELKSAIEAKLISIPRFGKKYFVSGLDNISLLSLEKLIQEYWNQYREVLDYEWERIISVLSGINYKNRFYTLNSIVKVTKIVDFKQLSRAAQEELLELSANSITTKQIQSGLEQRLMSINSWKEYFTLGLGNFSIVPTEQLTIDGKTYPIAQLFQEISKNKVTTFFGLSRAAANQYLKLIDARISVEKVRESLLAEYWNQLRSMLNNDFTLLPNGANNLSIRDKNINGFDTLFSNRKQTFANLQDSEKTLLRDAILKQENSPSVAQIKRELRRLRGDDISPITPEVPTKQPSKTPVKNSEQPDGTSSTQEKNDSEQTTPSTKNSKQKTKVSKSKTLTITLASVGGTALFAGVSGFLYWFIKLRK